MKASHSAAISKPGLYVDDELQIAAGRGPQRSLRPVKEQSALRQAKVPAHMRGESRGVVGHGNIDRRYRIPGDAGDTSGSWLEMDTLVDEE